MYACEDEAEIVACKDENEDGGVTLSDLDSHKDDTLVDISPPSDNTDADDASGVSVQILGTLSFNRVISVAPLVPATSTCSQ